MSFDPEVAQAMAHKAALTAAVVAMVMLAARLFGRQVAGLLTGLPIITTPTLLWVAVDQGSFAATRVAAGSVAACTVAAVFCLCYDRMARKACPAVCMAVAAPAVGLACVAAHACLAGLLVASLAATAVCGYVLHFLPAAADTVLPRSDIRSSNLVMTMLYAAASSALAAPGQVDPFSVGLLSGLPIVAATVVVAEHAATGPLAVRRFLRGYVAGLIGRSAFGIVFALLLSPAGLGWALVAASAASIGLCAFGATHAAPLHRLPAR